MLQCTWSTSFAGAFPISSLGNSYWGSKDVGEVQKDFECGMKVAGYDDIKVGDIIEAFRVHQVQRTLEMAGAKN